MIYCVLAIFLGICVVRSGSDFGLSAMEPNFSNAFTKLYIVDFGGTFVFPNFDFSFLNVIEIELVNKQISNFTKYYSKLNNLKVTVDNKGKELTKLTKFAHSIKINLVTRLWSLYISR